MRLRQEQPAVEFDSESAPKPIRRRLPHVAASLVFRPRTIGGQLTRILVFALALVLILVGITVHRAYSDYREADATRRAVSLALNVQDLTDQIQRELGLSNGLLGGDTGLLQPLTVQRRNVDSTLAAVEGGVDSDAPGADQVRSALGQLNMLGSTRTQIDTRRISRPVALQFYNDAVGALNHLTLGLDQANDPRLQRGLQAFYALGAIKDQFDRERGFLNGVFVVGHFSGGEYGQFMEIRAAKQEALQAFSRYAGKDRQADLDAVMRGDDAAASDQSESVALASGDGPLVRPVDPAAWWTHMTAVIDGQRAVQKAVGADIRSRADELRAAAETNLILFSVGAVIAIIAMIALVFASVRALVRPLAKLAAVADEVASRRLPNVIEEWTRAVDTAPEPPEPVRTPTGSSAEIAAVAGALDRVQGTAFELASQQALLRRNTIESMGNLARRNQNLVRRQLALISEFEREELDPKALSNLFELDHLATRMRRNAESLLVLVGESSPRRLTRPISLIDVIRAGMSEVDDYRRVVLRRVEDVLIAGAVASELSHMLAELIENGLAFSPPDLEVEIYARPAPQGGYLVAVVDHGIGMTTEQLAQSNAKLRGEQDFIVAPTRFLGHYVVGRLAQRLGIDVELTTSPVSGVVARLTLPPAVLVSHQDQEHATVQALAPGTVVQPTWGSDTEIRGALSAGHSLATAAAAPAVADTGPRRIPEPQAAGAGPSTTRNGLVKRTKRIGDNATATTPQSRPAAGLAPRPDPGPATQRWAPEETRDLLSSFRAGHQRGAAAGAPPLPDPYGAPTFADDPARPPRS